MTHPDIDVLAEFRAGLITGRRGARITAHLAGCDRCTALDKQLAGVSVLLASVPAPAVPDRVAQRLDTVLAAEVASRDQAERARGDGAAESPAPQPPRGNRGFRPLALRVLAPAAAVILLAAGGYGLSRAGLGSSSASTASPAGGAAKSVASPASVAAGAASGSSAKSATRRGNAPAAEPAGITPSMVVVISNRNLSRASLAQQVRAALLVSPAPGTTHAPSGQLRGCVLGLIGDHLLQRVESVRFEGKPATLVVARAGATDTAWIAALDCSATNRHVLASTSLPSGISGP
jgi:hypothetical protein